MLLDFKINRIIFFIGMIILFGITYYLVTVHEASTGMILVVALVFVFVMNFTMKRVANNMYRYMHQLLYVYADGEGYLEQVESLYKRSARGRKLLQGAKLQNLVMAYIFAGDLVKANELNDTLQNKFGNAIQQQPQMRFSQKLIDVMLVMFDYEKEAFNEKFENLGKEVDTLQAETQEYVKNNPYSIYYMIDKTKSFIETETITLEELEEALKDENEFLKTSVIYTLSRLDKLSFDIPETLSRKDGNTLFYKDNERKF
jgi:hypothetical protein